MKIEWFVIKNTWNNSIIKGGWGNGYFLIPKGHPLYGKHWDEVNSKYDVEVHGGMTFSSPAYECTIYPIPKGHDEDWVLGFDTMHYDDSIEKWPENKVREECARVAFRMFEIWLVEERARQKETK